MRIETKFNQCIPLSVGFACCLTIFLAAVTGAFDFFGLAFFLMVFALVLAFGLGDMALI